MPREGKLLGKDVEVLLGTVITGMGATALTDLWAIGRKRLLGVSRPNYGLVGRWLAHMSRGRLRHDSISGSPPVRGERLIGWSAHYLIGIAFAALLLCMAGSSWLDQPTILPALIIGIGSVLAPFLLMQPGMGAGLAASRAPHPFRARLQSLITHAIFGLGLHATASLAHLLQELN